MISLRGLIAVIVIGAFIAFIIWTVFDIQGTWRGFVSGIIVSIGIGIVGWYQNRKARR